MRRAGDRRRLAQLSAPGRAAQLKHLLGRDKERVARAAVHGPKVNHVLRLAGREDKQAEEEQPLRLAKERGGALPEVGDRRGLDAKVGWRRGWKARVSSSGAMCALYGIGGAVM
jgi:hypothetical protein